MPMAVDWENIDRIEFQALKHACITHDIDNCQRRFNILGKRMNWVGFGFVGEGKAQEGDIVVYDKED
jgi:hypothetical protein